MTTHRSTDGRADKSRSRGIIASFFTALARDVLQLFFAFAIGVGGAAVACWYYELPLVLSLGGGILVLGLAVALKTDSLFD